MKYSDYSDDILVSLIKEGDKTAMAEVYNRYWRKLLAVAYNHTRDKSTAQEIVQEVMIRIWDRRATAEIKSLDSYLSVAVRYSVYGYLSRERRRAEISFEQLIPDNHDQDDERIYALFLNDHINRAVESLPAKCKLVFTYSRFEGKSIPEISRHMEISEKTVEAHLTKALKSLRFSLKHAGWLIMLFVLGSF